MLRKYEMKSAKLQAVIMSGPGRPAIALNGAANTQQAGFRIQHQVPVNNMNRKPIYVGNSAVGYKQDTRQTGPVIVSNPQAGYQQHKQHPGVARIQYPVGGMQPGLPQHPVPRSRMMISSPQPGIVHFHVTNTYFLRIFLCLISGQIF